ncbi:uncharacterized protein LOC111370379 [Olea europaea var. sylvestris]|uniref:uncharacterized protein LOC111370379 n=1 Tax=Olea europaea var. sylvestris TaxID=158386 RepID=UPI000C1D7D33|nr:uncharacterized protein LOC111370379 [Olea europaea var. sylvestris]
MLDELRAQLLRTQTHMKWIVDVKRRNVQFNVEDVVYLKIRPYSHKRSSWPNEKLAPRFYGPFVVEKKVGLVAYKLTLPFNCHILVVFHVSQLRKAEANSQLVIHISSQLNEELEMLVEPKAVLRVRPRTGKNIRSIEALIRWKGLPPLEAIWEPYQMLKPQFPDFHLEDKVSFVGRSNDRPPIQIKYTRHKKKARAEKEYNEGINNQHMGTTDIVDKVVTDPQVCKKEEKRGILENRRVCRRASNSPKFKYHSISRFEYKSLSYI